MGSKSLEKSPEEWGDVFLNAGPQGSLPPPVILVVGVLPEFCMGSHGFSALLHEVW